MWDCPKSSYCWIEILLQCHFTTEDSKGMVTSSWRFHGFRTCITHVLTHIYCKELLLQFLLTPMSLEINRLHILGSIAASQCSTACSSIPGGLVAPGNRESDRPRYVLSCSSGFMGMEKPVNFRFLIHRWGFKIICYLKDNGDPVRRCRQSTVLVSQGMSWS